MATFFTADLHLAHRKILGFSYRYYLGKPAQMQGLAAFKEALNKYIEGEIDWIDVDIPEEDVKIIDAEIIRRINKKVQKNDVLYILGDIAAINANNVDYIKSLLGGIKCRNVSIIWGNHDRKKLLIPIFEELGWFIRGDRHEISTATPIYNKVTIVMDHYPMARWNKSHYGSWHLHGHTHGLMQFDPGTKLRYDVGIDINDYYPVSLSQLDKIMFLKMEYFHRPDRHRTITT